MSLERHRQRNRWLFIGLGILALAAVGVLLAWQRLEAPGGNPSVQSTRQAAVATEPAASVSALQASTPNSTNSASETNSPSDGPNTVPSQPTASSEATTPAPQSSGNNSADAGASAAAEVPPAGASGAAYDYAGRLALLAQQEAPLSEQQAAEIASLLSRLSRFGPSVLPAIEGLLREGVDASLTSEDEPGAPGATAALPYDSVRLGLFDVLRRIGGEDAHAILHAELGTTARPEEIRVIADYLEDFAPGVYTADATMAAQELLGMAAAGERGVEDVVPLFSVLESYGDGAVVQTLRNHLEGDWGMYAAVALGRVGDGAGIPALAQVATSELTGGESPDESQTDTAVTAVRVLAQAAATNGDAAAVLLDNAQSGRIPSSLWPQISSALGGDDQLRLNEPDIDRDAVAPYATSGRKKYPYNTHRHGQSVIYSVHRSKTLTEDEIADRLVLIDQLLDVVEDPIGRSALTRTRQDLLR